MNNNSYIATIQLFKKAVGLRTCSRKRSAPGESMSSIISRSFGMCQSTGSEGGVGALALVSLEGKWTPGGSAEDVGAGAEVPEVAGVVVAVAVMPKLVSVAECKVELGSNLPHLASGLS